MCLIQGSIVQKKGLSWFVTAPLFCGYLFVSIGLLLSFFGFLVAQIQEQHDKVLLQMSLT
jgi:hypothetical protein